MKKKTAAIILAAACLSACGNSSSGAGSAEDEPVSAAETSVQTSAEEITEAKEKIPESIRDYLTDESLNNKTVKWFSFYYPWHEPSESDRISREAEELFENKYGGKIDWYPTTYDNRFSDLAVMVTGGQGIDIIPNTDEFPRGCTNGLLQSYDKYVDLENPIWKSVKRFNDEYKIGDSHYLIVCGAEPYFVVFYNKKTIRENGFDDPWELYEKGEWTMEKFMDMLVDFVGRGGYGLDGWFNNESLYLAGGVAPVSFKDGRLAGNFSDPNFERAMNYQYELFSKGLVFNKELFDNASQEHFIGEGKELFYICGTWDIKCSPEVWTSTFGSAEDVAAVPIPRDEKADKYYHNVTLRSYSLCLNAENPEGAARLMDCMTVAYNDEEIRQLVDRGYQDRYGWSEEMLDRLSEIRRLAMENPVSNIYSGLPSEAYQIVNEAVMKPLNGEDWQSAKEAASELDSVISEINSVLDGKG